MVEWSHPGGMKELFRLRHILQILAAITFAALVSFIPHLIDFQRPAENATLVTVFLTFVLVFMMNEPIKNNQDLNKNVNLELSRIRRIHHLAEKVATPRSKWFKELQEAIFSYLNNFQDQSFETYTLVRERFREITHAVYGFKPKTQRDQIIFREMLETTRELAATRQDIGSLLKSRISTYRWVVLLTVETLTIVSILITQESSVLGFVLNTAIISAILVVTVLIYETDYYSKEELRQLARRYVDNQTSIKIEHEH